MKALFITVLLALTSVLSANAPATDVATLFHSAENLAIVGSPERVEACILHQSHLWFTRDERKRKYKEGRTLVLPANAAALVSARLTADATYAWDEVKLCMPVWNARFKFYRNGHCVAADLCFGCEILVLLRDGQGFSGGNFDHGSDALFEVIRSLFPKDEVVLKIVEMKKRREEARSMARRLDEEEKRTKREQPTSAPNF